MKGDLFFWSHDFKIALGDLNIGENLSREFAFEKFFLLFQMEKTMYLSKLAYGQTHPSMEMFDAIAK